MNNQDNMMYQPQQGRGGYSMQNQQMPHPNNVWNSQNRQSLDMPNLQSLGINSQGNQNPSNQGPKYSAANTLSISLIAAICFFSFSIFLNSYSLFFFHLNTNFRLTRNTQTGKQNEYTQMKNIKKNRS